MATIEGEILDYGENNKVADLDEGRIRRWKGYGFSDAHISDAMNGFSIEGENQTTELMTRHRHSLGIHPVFRMVDSCAAEFAAVTPYYYSTYEGGDAHEGLMLRLKSLRRGSNASSSLAQDQLG